MKKNLIFVLILAASLKLSKPTEPRMTSFIATLGARLLMIR